jgi:hypothetical protein
MNYKKPSYYKRDQRNLAQSSHSLCSHWEGCTHPSVNDWFGIHYCSSHYDAIRTMAISSFEEGERVTHTSFVYIERYLFMDVTRQLYEKLRIANAFMDLHMKIRNTLKKVGYLILAMIPLAFAIHLMW